MPKIKGGYYVKARKIQESEVAHWPPHAREIWDWLLLKANFTDGKRLKRGQLLTSYAEIREGLHWMVGWRKEKYSKWDCEKAMKLLTKATMVTTQKTTRGMIVTILNYDHYQNAENYESHKVSHKKATRKPQTTDTISKERKEYIKKKDARGGNGVSQKIKDYAIILKFKNIENADHELVSKYAWTGENWQDFRLRIYREYEKLKVAQ